MYEGVAEQLHHFIVASSTATAPSSLLPILPFTFPNTNAATTSFHHHHHHHDDPTTLLTNYPSSNHPSLLLNQHHHHSILSSSSSTSTQQQQQHMRREEVEDDTTNTTTTTNLVMMERERSIMMNDCPNWSNDEVLALLKIRSSLENWFHDFTNWDQVSRKMAEQGFKRSAEKCKEKYEEESRFFNLNTTTHTTTTTNNNNDDNNNNNKSKYMFLSELEELFHCDNDDHMVENKQIQDDDDNNNVQYPAEEVVEEMEDRDQEQQVPVVIEVAKKSHSKKKYKKRKIEMMKCFCESVVRNIMTQQEELYNKILEDMVKRDEENIAREEAWKKQEIDRFNKEVEIRANEQAIAYDRQASINDFCKNFAISQDSQIPFVIDPTNIPSSSTAIVVTHKDPISCTNQNDPNHHVPNSPNLKILNSQNDPSLPIMNSTQTPNNPTTPTSNLPSCQINENPINIIGSSNEEDKDCSKRWPRDEVLALISLRSNFYNTNEEKEGSISNSNNNKGPLWEKISQGMIELGYKRTAKRCKEKWENINKYFRKTKDTNASKKRSLNSRTCPYFHQLSNLYKQGSTNPSNLTQNRSPSPDSPDRK